MTKTKAKRRRDAEPRIAAKDGVVESASRRRRLPVDGGLMAELPQSEMTPSVRSTVMKLMDELDRVSEELLEARERVSKLEDMADEDPLVPVLNRRGFLRELERTLAYAARYETSGSLIFCDLDRFKDINDAYGHAAGDAALRFVAETLVGHVRRSDIVGRLGGDEFAVVLHRATSEHARTKADELMRLVAERPLDYGGIAIALSMSAGVAAFQHADTPADVLDRADKAMYRQKLAGRA